MTHKRTEVEGQQGYNVTVTGRHVHVTEAMKQHALDRIAKLEHFGNRIIDVHVILDIQKLDNRAEILLKYGHTAIRSHASTNDMYTSIDVAVEKLEKQLKRYKSKLQNHHAKGHPIEEVPVSVWAVQEVAIEEMESATNPFHSIVSHETRPLKILTDDEAIMKMELSHDPFMVYRCEVDRRLKVIYRRADGHYGVIKPE